MEMLAVILVIAGAFIFEFIDSSLGMGYGTLMTPVLLLLGLPLGDVVPAVLLSQGMASLLATLFHVRYGNVDLGRKGDDAGVLLRTVVVGCIAVALAVLLAYQIPQGWVEGYVALVALTMGLTVLWKRTFMVSRTKLSAVGLFAIFNKALTGGGFGPTYTTGQVISGRETRPSVGLTTAIEAPICLIAGLGYVLLNGYPDTTLLVPLSLGALLATPFGPYSTSGYEGVTGRMVLGSLAVFLGIFLLIELFIWPHLPCVVCNPFFWAMVSMFSLIGAMTGLISTGLGRFPRLNILFVGMFSFGRLMIPLHFVDQPRFGMGGWEVFAGLPIFVVGLALMTAIVQIRPWPSPDEKVHLATTGLYGLVRHPCYLGEVLWALGLSIMLGSVIGVALTPFWWAGLLFLTVLEEEDLERRTAGEYGAYRERVRGRILPGLPL